MSRLALARVGPLAALLAATLALGALGVLSAIALGAAPRARAIGVTHGARRDSCARHARHTHRPQRRAGRCRTHARHGLAVAKPTIGAPSVVPSATGQPAAATAAPAAAPLVSPPAILPAPGEATQEAPALEPEPPSVPHVQVSAFEYSFSLSRTTVPAGDVVLQFVNDGQDQHNLNVEPAGGPLAGSIGDTPSKGVSDLHLEMQPGSYTLFCSLPQHEQKGMKATLTVE